MTFHVVLKRVHDTMPAPLVTSGIRDNYRRGVVADFLRAKIQSGSRLSVVSAYFTIYAYDALREYLDQIDHLDFLFGEPRFIKSLDPDKTEAKAFVLDGNGLQLTNRLEQKRVARDCADWIRQKVAKAAQDNGSALLFAFRLLHDLRHLGRGLVGGGFDVLAEN